MPNLLRRSKAVTLDASGNGQVTFDTANAWQHWIITDVIVQTNQAAGSTPVPTAAVYLNAVSPVLQEGGTRDGDLDAARGRIDLDGSDTLIVAWTGGIAGTVATATIRGTFTSGE